MTDLVLLSTSKEGVYVYTMPFSMPRKKPEGPVVNFQLKLYGAEAERWLRIRNAAKVKNPYIDDTGVNRRLLGLDPDLNGGSNRGRPPHLLR